MVAMLSPARLRQAFFLRASWNDPLTLKLITLIGDSSRPLSTYPPRLARDFTRTDYWSDCVCSNYGCVSIWRMIHSGYVERSTGGRYQIFCTDAPEFE